MIGSASAPRRALRETLKETWARFATPYAPSGRGFFRRPEVPTPDAVFADRAALVALAIDRLSGASVRAAASGRPVSVSVPDAETAAVFEAALALTSKRRVTDRLLTIVVEEADRYPN